jgi:hypothetical protein
LQPRTDLRSRRDLVHVAAGDAAQRLQRVLLAAAPLVERQVRIERRFAHRQPDRSRCGLPMSPYSHSARFAMRLTSPGCA